MRSLNILVAEDDEQNQAMLKLILTRRGHQVKSVWNGLQALDAVIKGDFDVVLMDVNMPEMDGLEATRQIRKWENNKRRVPIVMLTASVPLRIGETYKAAGADTYISKPFDVKRLELVISVIANDTPSVSTEPTMYNMDGSLDDLVVLDMHESLTRFDGDEDMYRENLVEFIKGLPGRLEKMQQASTLQEWDNLSIHAHNLKGVSANFGANILSVLAYRLDEYSHLQKAEQALKVLQEIIQHIPILVESASKINNQDK